MSTGRMSAIAVQRTVGFVGRMIEKGRGCVKTQPYFRFCGPLTLPHPKIIAYSLF
jgi:hypothetical protein